jgi:hypothetical protein
MEEIVSLTPGACTICLQLKTRPKPVLGFLPLASRSPDWGINNEVKSFMTLTPGHRGIG